jgi:nitroimidazol reductase NimA-like FMN-containing flavoprotein (pyridoxamine 5'-phosphate oxidase superfamily)
MTSTEPTALSEDERDEFLGRGGTGVVSFATGADEPPHSVPVSYGYDREEATFYFRFAVESESEKGDLDGRAVSFVTYRRVDDRWHSVVASGRLESTTGDDVGTESLEGLDRAHIPLFDVFGRPSAEVPFEFFRLRPESLTARTESSTRP